VTVAPNQDIQVTAFMGDVFGRDHMNVYVGTPGNPTSTKLNPNLGTFDTTSQTYRFSSYSGVFNPGANTTIVITIETTFGGANSFWTINGIDVRPIGLVAPLTLTKVGGNATVAADGLTIDYYTGVGAVPNSEVTINPPLGTVVDADGNPGNGLQPDADPDVKGFQVFADASGNFGFGMRRPTGLGPITISAEDVTGAAGTGVVGPIGGGPLAASTNPYVLPNPYSQAYTLPSVRRIDFGPAGGVTASDNDPTNPLYLGFDGSSYASTPVNGLGWVGAAFGTFDRGLPSSAVQRDGVFGAATTPGDFEIDMPAANTPYSVTVQIGDPAFQPGRAVRPGHQPRDRGVIGTPVTGLSVPGGQSASLTFTATSDASGRLRIRFGATTVNGQRVSGRPRPSRCGRPRRPSPSTARPSSARARPPSPGRCRPTARRARCTRSPGPRRGRS